MEDGGGGIRVEGAISRYCLLCAALTKCRMSFVITNASFNIEEYAIGILTSGSEISCYPSLYGPRAAGIFTLTIVNSTLLSYVETALRT